MTTVSVCCRHVAAAKIDAEVTRLETEHGIKCRDAIKKVAYAPDYRPGDTGEFAFNKEGCPPRIDHTQNKHAFQASAQPPPRAVGHSPY